ncbi:MAG: HepT-like ribonuclease domain-containing protein [Ginsengibacter sp.]
MNPESFKYIGDILDSIEMIKSHLTGIKSFTEYKSNFMLIDAVERRLAIIGEALWKLTKLDKDINVTDKKKIIALRHILIHDYDLIDDASIWKIVHTNLEILKDEIAKILKT